MSADCGFFYDGAIWVQPTEIHVWDGSSYVQALQVFSYDGAAWIEIFPCIIVVNTQLDETSFILDTGQAVKIARTIIKAGSEFIVGSEVISVIKSILVEETVNILDTGAATKISRVQLRSALELIATSEDITLAKKRALTVEETALILDTSALTTILRDQTKTALELISTAEAITTAKQKGITVAETANIFSRSALTKILRDDIKTSRELVTTSETGAISITILPPVISSCAVRDPQDLLPESIAARCSFNTGNFTNSVRIDRVVNGSHTFHQNKNVSPNTNTILSSYHIGLCTQSIRFEIHPFSGSNQTGNEGTLCLTTPARFLGAGSQACNGGD